MSIHAKLLYSVALVTILFSTGCETANRIDEKVEAENGPIIQQPEIPTKKQDKQDNQDIIPIAPIPIEDNNDTTSVIKVDASNAYKLSMTLSQSKFQQSERGMLTFKIKDLYNDNRKVDVASIESVNFSADKRYLKFVDHTGTEINKYTIRDKGDIAKGEVRVKMNDNSGTTSINVLAIITLDGKSYELENTIPVVVIKNKTASIAVNPYGTKWVNSGENAGLFVEKYVFHVVDKYGNKAKDGTSVQIGVVNEPKLYTLGYSKTTNKQLNGTGKLNEDKTFTIASDVNASFLSGTIDSEDNLVILPNATKNDPTYLGAWSINEVQANVLNLVDDYTGNDKMDINNTDGLTFVIGDEDRFNPCSQTLANAAFYFPKGAEVKDGTVYAELRYQPYMVGKTVFVYANAVVDKERIGIAREMHLTGEGISSGTFSCAGTDKKAVSCEFDLGVILNGVNDFARNLTPSVSFKGNVPLFTNWSRINTGCGGHSYLSVTMDINESVTFSIGESVISEHIINK